MRTTSTLGLIAVLIPCILAQNYSGSTATCPADPFRFLRNECSLTSEGACWAIEEPPAPKEAFKSSSSADAAPVSTTIDIIPSLPTQPIIPADVEVEGEILSFEAWKQKQLQASWDAELLENEAEELKKQEGELLAGLEGRSEGDGGKTAEGHGDENAVQGNGNGHKDGVGQWNGETVGKKDGIAENGDKKSDTTPPAAAKQKPSGGSSNSHRYNYASPDCSARIISASSASSHPSSILHKSKDRYMLTPCNAKEHWVIIELCDEIRVEGLEVGMFEFFSGVVKDIMLSVGGDDEDDDYGDEDPVKGGWSPIANFTANNVRGSQTFNLPHPSSFHRQIRLDFPSHYGKEYYCPISSVKVYGMNQMEAFKWESRRNRGNAAENERDKERERSRRLAVEQQAEQKVVEQKQEPSTDQMQASSSAASTGNANTAADSQTAKATSITSAPSKITAAGSSSTTSQVTSSSSSSSTALSVTEASATDSSFTASAKATPHPEPLAEDVRETNVSAHSTNSSVAPVDRSQQAASEARGDDIYTHPNVSANETVKADNRSNTAPSSSISVTTPQPSPSQTHHSPSVPPVRPLPPKADSSESIYAFIIRRLTALEGNATLAMMYVEEQTKANRHMVVRLEKIWENWKVEEGRDIRMALERERILQDERMKALLIKLEERDELMTNTLQEVQNQVKALADEVTWEKRRGLAQFLLLIGLMVLGIASKAASFDAQLSSPTLATPALGTATPQLISVDPAGEASQELDFQEKASPRAKNRTFVLARPPRRPSTPTGSAQRIRPVLPPSVRANTDRNIPRTAIPARPRQSLPPHLHPRSVDRRLAKSSHLHTIDADRIRRKVQSEDANYPRSPVNEGRDADATPRLGHTLNGRMDHLMHADAGSDTSEYEGGSASEAESDLNMAREMTI